MRCRSRARMLVRWAKTDDMFCLDWFSAAVCCWHAIITIPMFDDVFLHDFCSWSSTSQDFKTHCSWDWMRSQKFLGKLKPIFNFSKVDGLGYRISTPLLFYLLVSFSGPMSTTESFKEPRKSKECKKHPAPLPVSHQWLLVHARTVAW